MTKVRSEWRSMTSYVVVTTGSIVGLGNIFGFPFLLAKYGGLFLVFYLLCLLFISLPLLFAELLIGRAGKQNPVGSIEIMAMGADASPKWKILGWLMIFMAYFTMGYYAVSAAFPVGYLLDNVSTLLYAPAYHGEALELDATSMTHFAHLEICFMAFLIVAMMIIYRGINRGLEVISFITVPLYLIIMLSLVIYVAAHGYLDEGMRQILVLQPDTNLLEIFLAALALAFLKYNVGLGVMIVYGSYLPYHVPLVKSTFIVVLIDAIVSLLAFFIIYPLMLINGYNVSATLSADTIINIFSGIPNGLIISALFFFAAILIAWTPLIAMAETMVITLKERFNWSRFFAATVIMLAVLLLGTFVVMAHTVWQDIKLFETYSLDNLLKNITKDVLVPMVALMSAIFVGWIMKRKTTAFELNFKPSIYNLWRFLMRFIIPIALIVVLIAVALRPF